MADNHDDLRRFIRHPSGVPIEVVAEQLPLKIKPSLKGVSLGGLSFASDHPVEENSIIRISIPYAKPAFESDGRVAWCEEHDGSYEIGIEFVGVDDAFRTRMIEQICHIEQYKKEIYERDGRVLSSEEAAKEWISRYASCFP